MPKLNRYKDGGFVYGQWREVGRKVDPITGDIIITERRDGSREVKYNQRGVNWRQGYQDWLAAGNEGTMDDFKLEAEAWKRAQDKKEFDSQNRVRRVKGKEEGESEGDEGKPSDDPRPDDFVGDGPGVGGPDGGGGSGDVSRPDKDDNVSRPRRPGDADTPSVSLLPKRPISPIYDGDYEQVPLVPFVSRDPTNIAIPASQIAMTPEQMGEVILEEGEGVGEVLPDSRVESEYNLRTDSRTNRRGKEIVKQTYTDNINLLRDDGSSTVNTRQVDRSKTGRPTRSRGRSVYQEFDSEGNRIFRDVNRFESGGSISKENMYYNKKEMGMGGKNMPKLMKKGGKNSFPDLTGDGKVTFADILKGRLKKGEKKSMRNGGLTESEYLRRLRAMDPDGSLTMEDGFDPQAIAERRQVTAAQPVTGKDVSSYARYFRPEQIPGERVDLTKNVASRLFDALENPDSAMQESLRLKGDLQAIDSMFPEDMTPMEKTDRNLRRFDAEMQSDVRKRQRDFARQSQAYGGKVKLMKKGGTVDYFAGGALAAGLGQFAQRSNNPLIQGIGKVASTVGGMTPGGKAVNMAANFLPSGNPMAALGQLMRGR